MNGQDAIDIARSIQCVAENEWIDVVDGVIHISCDECGSSTSLLIRESGPGMQRVNLAHEPTLTDAVRENEWNKVRLYREVIQLRERVALLSERVADAESILTLIAIPQRADGTWNRDRQACGGLAENYFKTKGSI